MQNLRRKSGDGSCSLERRLLEWASAETSLRSLIGRRTWGRRAGAVCAGMVLLGSAFGGGHKPGRCFSRHQASVATQVL